MTSADPEQRALAERVRHARATAGISQRLVAERVGIGRVAVADIEAGRRRLCVQEAVRLVQVLRVSLAELLGMPGGDAVPAPVRQLVAGLDEHQVQQLAVFAEFLLWRQACRGGQHAETGRSGAREVR